MTPEGSRWTFCHKLTLPPSSTRMSRNDRNLNVQKSRRENSEDHANASAPPLRTYDTLVLFNMAALKEEDGYFYSARFTDVKTFLPPEFCIKKYFDDVTRFTEYQTRFNPEANDEMMRIFLKVERGKPENHRHSQVL